jgi:hypothetical protein
MSDEGVEESKGVRYGISDSSGSESDTELIENGQFEAASAQPLLQMPWAPLLQFRKPATTVTSSLDASSATGLLSKVKFCSELCRLASTPADWEHLDHLIVSGA